MIVEGLVPDPRRPASTRVVIGGRPAWTVPADVIASLGLAIGQSIRTDVALELDRAADAEGAFRSGMRALERRAHGEKELARKLERKGHAAPAVAAAVARLCTLGLLDDLTFARGYVSTRASRGRGPVRLRYDLATLGIAKEVAERVIGELAAAVSDPLDQPRALLARRAGRLAGLPIDTRRRRMLAFLARRGYRGSDARELVEAALR